MAAKKQTLEDGVIVLPIKQLIAYAMFLITAGASIYTFFKAIPKIDKLDESVTDLKLSNTRVEERVANLKELIAAKSKDNSKPSQ